MHKSTYIPRLRSGYVRQAQHFGVRIRRRTSAAVIGHDSVLSLLWVGERGEIVEWAGLAHQLRRQAFASESLHGPRLHTATQSETLRCEPLRDEGGVHHAVLVPSSHADHPVVVIDLASIDVVDFLAAMLLTSEFGRAVVRDRLLHARAPLTNCQRGFILIASGDNTLPASLLCGFFGFSLSGSRLCILRFVLRGNQSQGQKGKHRRKTQRSE